MRYKYKYVIMKIQDWLTNLFRSKAFIYALIAIILGFVVVGFSVKTKNLVDENFYLNDQLELRQAQIDATETTNVTMQEINRVSKLLSFFFNDVITNKKVIVNGISEEFNDIYDYDMQILSCTKAGDTYEAKIVIAKPMNDSDELMYEPYKKYEVIIVGTIKGLKVDYINIIE